MSTPIDVEQPLLNIRECLNLYLRGKNDILCQKIFDVLKHFSLYNYRSFSSKALKQIDSYLEFVFFILTREDFRFPDTWVPPFVNLNHTFANLVAISNYKVTDNVIKSLLSQEGNYAKILFLYTCRNSIDIAFDTLIDINPTLASLWWSAFSAAPPGGTTELIDTNMKKNLNGFTSKMKLGDPRSQPVYFQCSYHGIDERPIKKWYNTQVRRFSLKSPIKLKPTPGQIAIVTDKWQPTTAVYKSISPQVKALAEKYALTLITTSRCKSESIDRSMFKSVITLPTGVEGPNLSKLAVSKFELAYFPDIGMTDDSVFLANVRLAPKMVCGYGHPVSTYGSFIDYFIGGLEVEDIGKYKENYSERLVLIPGLGAHPVDPKYVRKDPEKTDKILVNCCWTTTKLNWPMLQMLKAIQANHPKVHYQFFPSWTGTRYNSMPILARELTRLFGTNTTVFCDLPYQDYLTEMEKGHFTVDSYPFGGYNTIVDSLFVGCPVVTIEGTKFYNRASTALCRRVGVDLSTSSIKQCERRINWLLDNPEKLQQVRRVLSNTERLRELLITTDEPKFFVKAIDTLLTNQFIDSSEPIIIR